MFHLIKNYTTADFKEKNFAGGLSGNRLRRVTDFINDNLEQDLTLTEIAQVVWGVTTVQMPSPSVRPRSAFCTWSVMIRICSRSRVRTVNVCSFM